MDRLSRVGKGGINAEIATTVAIGSYMIDRWKHEIELETLHPGQPAEWIAAATSEVTGGHLHNLEKTSAAQLDLYTKQNATVVSVTAVAKELGPTRWERTWSATWFLVEAVKAIFALIVIIIAGTVLHWLTPRIEQEGSHNQKLITGAEEGSGSPTSGAPTGGRTPGGAQPTPPPKPGEAR